MPRVLLVPGRGHMLPEHWMRRWSDAHPQYVPVPRDDDPGFDLALRVAALRRALAVADEPAVLVAHSAGCRTVVQWAATHTGPVAGALLVTPPYRDDVPVYQGPLPFPSIVVASRTDPFATFEQSAGYARAWGAMLVDAGDAGHLNTAAGYGPWPAGEQFLADLLNRVG